jgi:hypothetical protein
MMALELVSTTAEEMSWFQGLADEKGRKPFRVAPWPRDIWLQPEACGGAPTCRLRLLELLLPGSGFTTLILNSPAEDSDPVAVSCVAETNVVVSGIVPSSTWAPGTKLLPVRASEKLPVPMLAGFVPVREGVGFKTVTALEEFVELEAMLVAVIVRVFGVGSDDGAL